MKSVRLRSRAQKILAFLDTFGGEATTRQIAERAGLSVNGVSQTLGSLCPRYVSCLGGTGGETRWNKPSPPTPRNILIFTPIP